REATDRDARELEKEAALARELGIAAEFLPAVPFVGRPGVKFAHQALFHPRKYLAAVASRIPGGGSHVFENAAADEVRDRPLAVKSGAHTVRCEYLVLATHTPLMGHTGLVRATLFQTRLALYSTYALGAKVPTG